MYRPGQLTFTGAGLAENQDIGVRPGHLPRGFQHHHHGRAMGVQAVFGLAHLAFQRFQPRRELTHLQLLGRGQAQLVGAARLDQVVGGASLDGVHGGIHGRMGGHNHHAHPRSLHAHLGQHVQAIVLAQAQVEEAQVEHLTLHQGIGLCGTVRGGDGVALIFQAIAEGAQDRGFVIH